MTTAIDASTNPEVNGTGRERKLSTGSDLPYRVLLIVTAVLVGGLFLAFIGSIVQESIPGWRTVGWTFFTGTNWNYGAHIYGALPLIVGTVLTTGLALLLAVPVGFGTALAIVFLIPRRFQLIISSIVELLAVVPSIIYGVWGYLTIQPWLDATVQPWLASKTNGHFPFSGLGIGFGLMLGSLVLAVMILPTIAAISRDVVAAVPNEMIEGALSLGATKSQVLRKVVVPSSRSGLLGAVTLGTGRALGETIAMVVLLGGVNQTHPIPVSLFGTTGTLASEIANNFGNLSGAAGLGVLCCLALVLMVIIGLVNLSARVIVARNLRKFQQ